MQASCHTRQLPPTARHLHALGGGGGAGLGVVLQQRQAALKRRNLALELRTRCTGGLEVPLQLLH